MAKKKEEPQVEPEEQEHVIRFEPVDQTDAVSDVHLKDGSVLYIMGTPAATYAALTNGLAQGRDVMLETIIRDQVPVDPKQVEVVTCAMRRLGRNL